MVVDMRKNGTLMIAHISDMGVDEYGELIDSALVGSNPIPCLIRTISDERLKVYEDGEFRSSAYEVLLEASEKFFSAVLTDEGALLLSEAGDSIVINTDSIRAERIALRRQKTPLGEFRIQTLEVFPRMGRILLKLV